MIETRSLSQVFGVGEHAHQVLTDINLFVERASITAIVGPSGAGKSTIAGLIPRFYDPTEGTVEIDGHDLRTVTLESLRSQVGLVSRIPCSFG